MVESYLPVNLEEALQLRSEMHAVPVAGGTDILVRYRNIAGAFPRFPWPVIYISGLAELQGIEVRDAEVIIRSGTSLAEIAASEVVPDLLKRAVYEIAAPALRNRATLAGNICNASPAGDGIAALYALHAEVELTSSQKMRRIPLDCFITGPGATVLAADELMTAIRIPSEAFSLTYYRKVGTRRANALSKLSCVGLATIDAGCLTRFRLALGAIGPVVVSTHSMEQHMLGATAETFKERRAAVLGELEPLVRPIDDQRSTAAYRKAVALNLVRDFFDQVEEQLR